LPDISLDLGGYWITLNSDDLIVPFNTGSAFVCMLTISDHDEDFIIIGSNFMAGYAFGFNWGSS